MNHVRRILQSAAFVFLIPASALLMSGELPSEHPANPAAKTLPLPDETGPLATYVDPKLRGEGPDSIERSDFQQARGAAPQPDAISPGGIPAPSPSGGQSGHKSGSTDHSKH